MSLLNRVVYLRGVAMGVVKVPKEAIRDSGDNELYEDDRILLSGVSNRDSLPVLSTLSVLVCEGVTTGVGRNIDALLDSLLIVGGSIREDAL